MKKASRRAAARSRRSGTGRRRREGPATWLAESEALFRDFARLTPYKYTPFVKTFDSFDEYERWRRDQTNPWYR